MLRNIELFLKVGRSSSRTHPWANNHVSAQLIGDNRKKEEKKKKRNYIRVRRLIIKIIKSKYFPLPAKEDETYRQNPFEYLPVVVVTLR